MAKAALNVGSLSLLIFFSNDCSLLLKIFAVISTVQILSGRSFYLGTSILLVLIPVDILVKIHVEFQIILCPMFSKLLLVGGQL
jgi:hypothetical protein